ncbi:hypothetical protein BSF38_00850 [Paludisphaera borealis]|uniref:Uncharacterized protein n=1 Tax=Paludisphaera borealis TaxID=1387353 RepID=A0A1U7CKI9_9BACT|nr:hypothetical protein BSF38_00850 [Paludisphaera borealis]
MFRNRQTGILGRRTKPIRSVDRERAAGEGLSEGRNREGGPRGWRTDGSGADTEQTKPNSARAVGRSGRWSGAVGGLLGWGRVRARRRTRRIGSSWRGLRSDCSRDAAEWDAIHSLALRARIGETRFHHWKGPAATREQPAPGLGLLSLSSSSSAKRSSRRKPPCRVSTSRLESRPPRSQERRDAPAAKRIDRGCCDRTILVRMPRGSAER